MLRIQQGFAGRNCQGISRRTALEAGFLGLSGLSLADLLAEKLPVQWFGHSSLSIPRTARFRGGTKSTRPVGCS